MIISFSGLDGSGKTSHVNATIDFLKKLNKKTAYLHVQEFSIFAKVNKILEKLSPKTSKSLVNLEFDTNKKSFLRKVISVLRQITSIIDIYRFKIKILGVKNKIFVCDRFFYDMLIQTKYLKMYSNLFLKFYQKIIPKTDIAFLLHIDAKKAFKRANEYNLELFLKKEKIYKSLDIKFIKLNTALPFNIVQNKIKNTLKKRLK